MTLRLAILGDSIGYGVGASRPEDALAPRLSADLETDDVLAETRVFAVPGARSSGLSRQVRQALRWEPDLALIVIGANDLTHFVPPEEAAGALGAAVSALAAAGVRVVVAPAPDLSVVPHVPALMRDLVSSASALLRAAQIRATEAAGGLVVEVANSARAFAADAALFSSDRFHPSSAGYAVIAASIAPVLRAAAHAALAVRRAG